MGAVFNILGAALALVGFIVAIMWVFTPKRSPAVRSRRGWGAVLLFGAAAAAYVLGGNLG